MPSDTSRPRPRPVKRYDKKNQLVVIAEKEQADRVRDLTEATRLSQSEIMRQIIRAGLPSIERRHVRALTAHVAEQS